MPNYCYNKLIVTGNKKTIDKFITYAAGKEDILDEEAFIPYPKRFKALDKNANVWQKNADSIKDPVKKSEWMGKHPQPRDGFNQGGYEWCCKHWGTKWGFGSNKKRHRLSPNCVRYCFESAWAPPLPLLLKASKTFPVLTFAMRATDEGNMFDNLFTFRRGKCSSLV